MRAAGELAWSLLEKLVPDAPAAPAAPQLAVWFCLLGKRQKVLCSILLPVLGTGQAWKGQGYFDGVLSPAGCARSRTRVKGELVVDTSHTFCHHSAVAWVLEFRVQDREATAGARAGGGTSGRVAARLLAGGRIPRTWAEGVGRWAGPQEVAGGLMLNVSVRGSVR